MCGQDTQPTTPVDSKQLSKLGCLRRIFSAKGVGTLNSAKEKFRKKELFLAKNANFSPFWPIFLGKYSAIFH